VDVNVSVTIAFLTVSCACLHQYTYALNAMQTSSSACSLMFDLIVWRRIRFENAKSVTVFVDTPALIDALIHVSTPHIACIHAVRRTIYVSRFTSFKHGVHACCLINGGPVCDTAATSTARKRCGVNRKRHYVNNWIAEWLKYLNICFFDGGRVDSNDAQLSDN
jgi:hypothetical protein